MQEASIPCESLVGTIYMEDAGKLLEGSKGSVSLEGAAGGLGSKCMAGGIFRRFVDTGHSKEESAEGQMVEGAHNLQEELSGGACTRGGQSV